GHPVSALTALGLAWFGFLHPLLSVGIFAGMVEAHFRPPTADDFKKILKDEYLFNWNEIPGKDSGRVIEILKKEHNAEWLDNANFEKIDDGKTIRVSAGSKQAFFKMNENKGTVKLSIDNGKAFELIVEEEKGKLNVYKPQTMTGMMDNKLFRIVLVAGLANLGSMLGTFVAIPLLVAYLGIDNPLYILKTALDTGISALMNII
ncbi:MAG: hypothetical protein KKA10_03990, partial [Euryarchaeota archaeon]|nr:hypothetical protein [Euryarchaeota archaeon]